MRSGAGRERSVLFPGGTILDGRFELGAGGFFVANGGLASELAEEIVDGKLEAEDDGFEGLGAGILDGREELEGILEELVEGVGIGFAEGAFEAHEGVDFLVPGFGIAVGGQFAVHGAIIAQAF